MKKLLKKVVTGILAVSMMLSSVGVSYAMPLWDYETNTPNLPYSSDSTERVDVTSEARIIEISNSTIEIPGSTESVGILPEGGTIWFDSSKAKAEASDIVAMSIHVYNLQQEPLFSDVWYDIKLDTKYCLYDAVPSDLKAELKNIPHVFSVAIVSSDLDEQGDESYVLNHYSYYQGFSKKDAASSLTTSWKSNSTGWWVERSDGSYLKNEWYQSPASGLWYYMGGNGYMLTNDWYQSPSSGSWYYMGADGHMLTNTTTPDGYKVNADGVWVQ